VKLVDRQGQACVRQRHSTPLWVWWNGGTVERVDAKLDELHGEMNWIGSDLQEGLQKRFACVLAAMAEGRPLAS
jgi:hypothetical protein